MKVINVYRASGGDLLLQLDDEPRVYGWADEEMDEDFYRHVRHILNDPDGWFAMEFSYEDGFNREFPNGLEAAFVTSITEEELNNV